MDAVAYFDMLLSLAHYGRLSQVGACWPNVLDVEVTDEHH